MSENISFNSAELGAPVETLGYEQARAELEQVVRQLESGASDLETSIALWAVSYTHLTLPTKRIV